MSKKALSFRIWKSFSTDFDELQNIEITNRKSDIGFSEFWQMAIKMRPWTLQVWNTLTWNWWVSWQFFFVDFFKKKHHLKWFNKKIWRLNWSTWVDLWFTFISNKFSFNPILLPVQLDWTIPTIYITGSDSSAWERVKKSASDPLWAAAIWKYLIITDNTWNKQAYRGAFAFILDYDTTTLEYTLNWAGITIILKSWAKYQIYDTLGEYLQVSNWEEYEKYFFWKNDWTITENTTFSWLATKALRLVKWIQNSEFIVKQISYYGSFWTFNKNSLYYSAGWLNNPFLYNFTTVLSIPWNISGKINDLFIFKDRLIIWWDTYIAYLRWPLSGGTEIHLITQSYWITPKTLIDVWIDAYFLSTNKHIYSLKENLAWTTIEATDEWKIIWNYIKDYNFNLMGTFDWSKLYFYWEKVSGVSWIITVLDIQYKFWSIYTWLAPSDIQFDWWKIYLSDNNSDKVRVFSSEIKNDIWIEISQKISLKEISLWKPFTTKSMTDVFIWLDNFSQNLSISTYMAVPWRNTKKSIKNINITASDVWVSSIPLWNSTIWTWIIWWSWLSSDIWLPIMKHIQYSNDKANFWKIIIEWINWSAFYLNQLDVLIEAEKEKEYFPPKHTI